MKKSLRITSMVLGALLFFSYNSLKAQVKIGGNPAVVDKNAILELESTRKGLLLPRLTAAGFTLLNASTPIADGLLIYLNETSGAYTPGFYVRQNNAWQMVDASDGAIAPWRVGGNNFAIPGTQWMGTKTNHGLEFRTNNAPRMSFSETGRIDLLGGNYFFGAVPAAAAAENDVLIIDANGQIFKKTFNNVNVTSLQGLSGALALDVSAAAHQNAAFATTTGSQTISLNLPVMEDPALQDYGFIRKEDFQKLMNLTTAGGFTFADAVADNTLGAKGGKFEWDAVGNKWTLTLNEAGETHAGIVTATGTQTFGGDKIFKGNVTVGTATANLNIGGNVVFNALTAIDGSEANYNMLVANGANQLRSVTLPKWKFNTEGVSGIIVETGTAPFPSVVGAAADGRLTFQATNSAGATDFSIKPAGANKIEFDLPDASATARGVITKDAQTIGGAKTFAAEVTASAGATVQAGLNLQGGLKVVHKAVTAGYDIEAIDYVLLVKGSGSSVVDLKLKPANAHSGRVYVINRLPQGGVVTPDEESSSVVEVKDGATVVAAISEPYTTVTIMSDGTKWIVMSRSMGGL